MHGAPRVGEGAGSESPQTMASVFQAFSACLKASFLLARRAQLSLRGALPGPPTELPAPLASFLGSEKGVQLPVTPRCPPAADPELSWTSIGASA